MQPVVVLLVAFFALVLSITHHYMHTDGSGVSFFFLHACTQALASSASVVERIRHSVHILPDDGLGSAAGAMILRLAGTYAHTVYFGIQVSG